jgi:hypothetical protein
MKAGGVQVVVTSAMSPSLGALSQYAAVAHDLGISVMWEIGDPNWWQQPPDGNQVAADLPQFATACGCSQNQALLTYVVHWLRALPGTYGYYAADDSTLQAGDEAAIATYMAQIKQLDPNHPAMIGSYSEQQRDSHQSIADLIGQEIYPVTTSPTLPLDTHPVTWDAVRQTVTATQSSADRAGKASAFILQAFTWGDNLIDGEAVGVCSPSDTLASCYTRLRYPSAAEQLALRDAVLSYAHPALILWYSFPGTYGSAVSDPSIVYPSGADAAARWAGLSAAIRAPWPLGPANTPAAPSPVVPRSASSPVVPHTAPSHHLRGKRKRKHARRHRRHATGFHAVANPGLGL